MRTSVPLALVLPFVECASCQEASVVRVRGDIDANRVEIEALGSAKPAEQIAALRVLADIGVGPDRQLSIEAIRERIQRMLETLRKEMPDDLYSRVVPQLKQIWTTSE